MSQLEQIEVSVNDIKHLVSDRALDGDTLLLNMGPQHPSTHGVLRLVLRTDGEVISEVEPHIGYLHRCAEKIGENLTPRQWIPYTDRMDYLAGMNMNLGWSLCVEKLLDYHPRYTSFQAVYEAVTWLIDQGIVKT